MYVYKEGPSLQLWFSYREHLLFLKPFSNSSGSVLKYPAQYLLRMNPKSLAQFAFHLAAFVSIAFVASMFVLPFITVSFVLSSMTVGLSFASRSFFQVGMFFYDRFVMFLQVQLRSMIEQMPSNQPTGYNLKKPAKPTAAAAATATATATSSSANAAENVPVVTTESLITEEPNIDRLLIKKSQPPVPTETLGANIPLHSSEESLLDTA